MSEAERAYERALTFLEKRDRTEREVLDKLCGAGYGEEAALAAIERLRDAGLVNDEDYAARYLMALIAKGRGRLRISSEMRRKGLSEELVRNTIEDGLSADDEREMAADAARRCLSGLPKDLDRRKAAVKVNRKLAVLGFTWDVIGSAVREMRIETDDVDDEEVQG